MVAYYEAQADRAPARLLPALARLLGVTADEILGAKPLPSKRRAREGRLWRRFKDLEQLPGPQRRQLVQLIDAFLERERLREKLRGAG
jgi:hypothetical protein